MKETVYKYHPALPYSLHDMRVQKIAMGENSIEFFFENGYVACREPFPQVDGSLKFEGVDFDFCCVELLSKNGEYGPFRGRKMELSDFVAQHPASSFEIVDELYGYNQAEYSGYLSLPGEKDFLEMVVSLYFTGNMIYKTE